MNVYFRNQLERGRYTVPQVPSLNPKVVGGIDVLRRSAYTRFARGDRRAKPLRKRSLAFRRRNFAASEINGLLSGTFVSATLYNVRE